VTGKGRAAGALGHVTRVCVGSAKAPKIEAVRSAVEAFAPGVVVEGVAVDSGVPEQPVGLDEIATGARNRARRALAASGSPCELAFGIEDGLIEVTLGGAISVFNVGCALVTDGVRESIGLTSGFAYPPDCTTPALERRADIGSVFDRVWRDYRLASGDRPASGNGPEDEAPSGAGPGNIGKLTLGVLPRSEYGRHAVVCALVRFLHPSLYFAEESGAADRGIE
jgi:inosine/xanthosine triphosphatase